MSKTNIKKSGAIPSQLMRQMISRGEIVKAKNDSIQPASIDLCVSDEGYRMKGTFLPKKGESVRDIIKNESLYRINLSNPLEKSGVYLIKLIESLALSPEIFAIASSKSSTGRVDLQTRLIVDDNSRFDDVPCGYEGELWLQVIPKSFLIKLNSEDKLNQLRFFNGDAKLSRDELLKLYISENLLVDDNLRPIDSDQKLTQNQGCNLTMCIDLEGSGNSNIIGYKNLLVDQVLDFSKRNYYDMNDFFEPIAKPRDGKLILEKGSFYIFSTKEMIRVPRNYSAEMIAYDIFTGEFRSHYAGFFDPGFGYGEKGEIKGRQAVLEVRSFDSNFIFRDGQPICQMNYENLVESPDFVYSEKIGSHYANQKGPKLSKHFK
ncbi:MAG: 2'-deoxycytidine 5'-triphosphate deaminase [Candidatus Paceibacterota bacterium]|jgi:dCTP deaminase